jgi:hypothetical protein
LKNTSDSYINCTIITLEKEFKEDNQYSQIVNNILLILKNELKKRNEDKLRESLQLLQNYINDDYDIV